MRIIEGQRFSKTNKLSSHLLEKTIYKDCVFDTCDYSAWHFTACDFISCRFYKCTFKRTHLAINHYYNSGKFDHCRFEACNLTEAKFSFPVISHTEFVDCTLKETNFDGSRLSNCRFAGKILDSWFYGYCLYPSMPILSFLFKYDRGKVMNKMEHVDFREAELDGVSFSRGISLDTCLFPQGEHYLYIADWPGTIERVRNIISSEWPSEDKAPGLEMLDNYFYIPDKREQRQEFLDTKIFDAVNPYTDLKKRALTKKCLDLMHTLQGA